MTRSKTSPKTPVIVADESFSVESGPTGFRRALLLNPPVYDAQYWARWSQPAGLLRIATYLKKQGYDLGLIDAMETNALGFVPKTARLVKGSPQLVARGELARAIYHFGTPWDVIEQRMRDLPWTPDEVWITSIMTYWWESTRDTVALARRLFPHARILVGGIYPTLAPAHARDNLTGADFIFAGELRAASELPTDLSLYERSPTYAILATTRGCPWDCHYCAARSLNAGSSKMRARSPEDVVAEIRHKIGAFGIRRFGFYEDNALALRGHLQRVLEAIMAADLGPVQLYAPEGFETRLLTEDLLRTMKQAGFEKVHLPFEALRWETNLGWNRRHASTASFEQALDAAIKAGFKPRSEDINAFVLFGLPDDKLEDIMDGVLYIHDAVGSIIPMLFTPVPGTHIYREHESYLHGEMGWDLQDLNGKFLPFLEYNARRYPGLRGSDYLELEALMSVLNNGKILWRTANLCGDSRASTAFRSVLCAPDGLNGKVAAVPRGRASRTTQAAAAR
jgi:radical SAM superfamily enzyme YgiQ (UPF0313 family)